MAKIKLKTGATIEETFQDFIISRRVKGLKEKTIESYQNHFHAVARHLDVEMDIDMLQKSDLDRMIVSMRDAELSANSINSYTRTLKSFFSWCNEEGILRLNNVWYRSTRKCCEITRFRQILMWSDIIFKNSVCNYKNMVILNELTENS